MGVLLKLLRGFFSKSAKAGLILGLALTACGLWLFLRDNGDFDGGRHDLLRSNNGERAKIELALGESINTVIPPAGSKMFERCGAVLSLVRARPSGPGCRPSATWGERFGK